MPPSSVWTGVSDESQAGMLSQADACTSDKFQLQCTVERCTAVCVKLPCSTQGNFTHMTVHDAWRVITQPSISSQPSIDTVPAAWHISTVDKHTRYTKAGVYRRENPRTAVSKRSAPTGLHTAAAEASQGGGAAGVKAHPQDHKWLHST